MSNETRERDLRRAKLHYARRFGYTSDRAEFAWSIASSLGKRESYEAVQVEKDTDR